MTSVRVRYQTYEYGDADIHLKTLRDLQQFEDPHGEAETHGVSSAIWPMFGVVWESGEVLARLMSTYDIEGLRILELGCGIGLASIVLASRHADVTATDQNPEAANFLACNARLNGLPPISFVRSGWIEHNESLGEFDLIIGSDVLYEYATVGTLTQFIERHAREHCKVIVVDPGRGQQGKFTRRMSELGYEQDVVTKTQSTELGEYGGRVLRYTR